MRPVLLILLLAPTASAQMFGTWTLNPALSNGQGSLERTYTLRLEPHPEGERITIWRVTAKGSSTEMYILRMDGKDHPYTISEEFDTIAARKLPDGSLEEVAKKGGQVVVKSRRYLSADGNQLIQEYQWIGRPGRRATLVLERAAR